ncbi:hypothetical protein M1D52_09360 [Olivibacter sp. SA151]|uniref:hypothetical protein n=1 Tax=Olivibacter jilunii TaxID=985016 RepID=UPI003F18F5DC
MKKHVFFFIVMLIFSCLPIYLLHSFSKPKGSEMGFRNFFSEDTLRKSFEKQYANVSFQEMKYANRHFYIHEISANSILEKDLEGEDIGSFSLNNIGQLLDYLPFDSTMGLADLKNQQVSFINYSGIARNSTLKINKLRRVGFLSKSHLISKIPQDTTSVYNGKDNFAVYDLEKGTVHKINILPNIENNGMIYDGNFIEGEDKSFYFTYFFNELFAFDSIGNLIYKTKTIDRNLQKPEIKLSANGWRTFDKNVELRNKSGTTDEKYLYLLTSMTNNSYSYVDVYNKENGNYVNSLLVPFVGGNRIIGISKVNNKLYCITKNAFACFNFK